MRSDVVNFKQLFEGGKQYTVPLFQRNYTWDTKNWKQLWEDLLALTEEGEDQRQHFLGPVITLPHESDPAGLAKFMLIDGQQRISTLCVLFNSIRAHVQLSDSELCEELLEEFLINKRKSGTDYYKLLSGTYDRETYFQIINLELPKDRSSNLARAYLHFNNELRKLNPNSEQIHAIKDALLGRMTLISIVLDPKDNPYEVFESINSKGLALTEAELIKNYLLMRIDPAEHEEVFQKYWNPMEESLGESLTEYIRHFETRRGQVVKVKEIYATVRKQVMPSPQLSPGSQQTKALDYLKEVHGLHGFYRRFLDPGQEPDRFARVHLTAINQQSITVVYPYLLNLYEYHAEGQLTDAELLECLQIIENLLVRRLLIGDGNQGLNKEMPNLHHVVLKKKETSPKTYPQILREVLWSGKSYRYVSDEKLKAKLRTESVFGGGKKSHLAKLVLNRIEDYLTGREPGTSSYEVLRILPEKLDGDWFNELTPADREQVRDFVDLIGNLALCPTPHYNEKHSYPHKRNLLKDSGIDLNAEFHDIETWNLHTIRQRNARMAEWIMAVWPQLGTGGSPTTYTEEDPTYKKPVSFTLLGQEYLLQDQTWKELLIRVVEECAELASCSTQELLEEVSIKYSRTDTSLRSPGRVGRTGLYIETSYSALTVLQQVKRLVEAIDLDYEADFSCHMVAR